MNHNRNDHPQHPVRDAFYCVWCFFFSLAFSYLWVHGLFDFEYASHALAVAVLILVAALIGAIVSFRKNYTNYFRYRRNLKRKRDANRGGSCGNDRDHHSNNRSGNRDNDRYHHSNNRSGNRYGRT